MRTAPVELTAIRRLLGNIEEHITAESGITGGTLFANVRRLAAIAERAQASPAAEPAPEPIEIRLNEDGTLDEVCGGRGIHLEQMSPTHWWMAVYEGPGDARVTVNFHAKGKITANVEREGANLAPAPAAEPVLREALERIENSLKFCRLTGANASLVIALSDCARAALAREPVAPSPWISVADRLPLEHDLVIVDGGVARWRRGEWITETGHAAGKPILWQVTHWMPMPKAPIGEPVALIETAGSSLADPLSPQDRKLVDGVLDDLAGLISPPSSTEKSDTAAPKGAPSA